MGSSLWARTAVLNTRGGATGGEGVRGIATSGCDAAAAGSGAGSWASAGGRAPASADDGRMAVAFASAPAAVSCVVAGVLVLLELDSLGLELDPLGVGFCFAALDVDPLGVGFCFCGICFLLSLAVVVSPVPVAPPLVEAPSFGAGVGIGLGGTVVPVGSGFGDVPVGAGVAPGSCGAGAAGSTGAGAACASPATGAAGAAFSSTTAGAAGAVSAAFSSTAMASPAAEAGVHQAIVSMRTTPAHAPRHRMNDAPGPNVVNRHPFALPCDVTATVPRSRPLV